MNIIQSKFFAGLTAGVAFTSVVASASIANAAALMGEFQFSSGFDVAQLTKDELIFNPNPSTLSIAMFTTTGSFMQFGNTDTTTIEGPVQFDPFSAPVPFIDFGGSNVFNLENAEIGEVIQSGQNASVDIILEGIFESASGDQSDGAGNITLQFNDTSASAIEDRLEAGETLTAQFSGALFSTSERERVPEPSAILGLGLFAGAGILSKNKLANKA